MIGEHLGHAAGLRVERVIGMRAGRPEHRDLRDVAVGRERAERSPHLLERGVRDLQVEAIGLVAGEAHRRRDDLEELVAVALDSDFVEQVGDLGVEVAVAGPVAGEAGGRSHVASA